jgi:crooked neck
MQWRPDPAAWSAYIKFETRYKELELARAVCEKFTQAHPSPAAWLRWVHLEEEFGTTSSVRDVYLAAVDSLGEFTTEKVFISFARFENRVGEPERAKAIYRYALDRLPRSKSGHLHAAYVRFEKQFGDQEGVENVVLTKRRLTYETQLKHSPTDYDTWISLAQTQETAGNMNGVREAYERAIKHVPPPEKRFWRRYIYLFLFYAAFEEIVTKDMDRAAQIYETCLRLIPHQQFTFSKAWIATSHFRLRQLDIKGARRILGKALGMCPKRRIFREYISLEKKLAEYDRVRKLYEKYVSWDPANSDAWIDFASLEASLCDFERCRALFELAIEQEDLDAPEKVWKKYIDFETAHGEFDRARALYNRLLEKVPHHKVFASYANWEVSEANRPVEAAESGEPQGNGIRDESIERARKIFDWANRVLKDSASKDERKALLDSWATFEKNHGNDETLRAVEDKMPVKVVKRVKLDDHTFEEIEDLEFEEERPQKFAKLLAMAAEDSDEE